MSESSLNEKPVNVCGQKCNLFNSKATLTDSIYTKNKAQTCYSKHMTEAIIASQDQ